MEISLVREFHRAFDAERQVGRFGVLRGETEFQCGFRFILKLSDHVPVLRENKGRDLFEVAVDAVFADYFFYQVDGRLVGLRVLPRPFFSYGIDHFAVLEGML